MVDSMNARKGLFNKKMTNAEYRKIKTDFKKSFDTSKITSEYFEHFDDIEVKTRKNKQDTYFKIAAEVAVNSDMCQKHGAVIVYKKEIIACGYNYYYSTFSIHAEVAAISQLKGRDKEILSECELYVVRIGPDKLDNPLKYSRPCNNCQHFINKNCIKKTFYSTNYEYDSMMNDNRICGVM